MDSDGILLGEIAHIRSPVPDGPRYDRSRSNEHNRDFDNLLLLCAKHHKIVDSRSGGWMVDQLTTMKVDHENVYTSAVDQLRQLVGDITKGDTPRPARNGTKLNPDLDDDERAETVAMLNALCSGLVRVPIDSRSALALMVDVSDDGIDITLLVLNARAAIETGRLIDHLKILEHYGIVYIDVPTAGEEYEPRCAVAPRFQDAVSCLKHLAESGGREVISRAIIDLDFTVFDE